MLQNDKIITPLSASQRKPHPIWNSEIRIFIRHVISPFHPNFEDKRRHTHYTIEHWIPHSFWMIMLYVYKTWMEGTYDIPNKNPNFFVTRNTNQIRMGSFEGAEMTLVYNFESYWCWQVRWDSVGRKACGFWPVNIYFVDRWNYSDFTKEPGSVEQFVPDPPLKASLFTSVRLTMCF